MIQADDDDEHDDGYGDVGDDTDFDDDECDDDGEDCAFDTICRVKLT
jgi:hypothetical protein